MFTGCIRNSGELLAQKVIGAQRKITIRTDLAGSVAIGESVAVNGACLTVEKVNCQENTLDFHILSETLEKTNLGSISIETLVNLEQALSLGDRLDGHLITGHVDCVSNVIAKDIKREDVVIELQLPEKYKPLLIEKGSIAIDGVSLTIASLNEESFSVHLIPYTLENTNLATLEKGHCVNLETDIIGKYVGRSKFLESKV